MAEKYYIGYSPGILVERMLREAGSMQARNALLQVQAYPRFTANLPEISDRFVKPTVLSGATTSKSEVLAAIRRSDILFFFGHTVPDGRGVALKLNDKESLTAIDFTPGNSASLFAGGTSGVFHGFNRAIRPVGR